MKVLNFWTILSTLGALLFFLGVALLVPMGVGLYYGAAWGAFALTSVLSFGLGGGMWRYFGRKRQELRVREGFAIVALSWFLLSAFGALPFLMSGVLTSYTDAFFETVSGFTTTGATVFGGAHTPTIEALPHAVLMWRSLAHWVGGMGIIVLTLAILPILGVGGMQLYKAEVPGPSADKLTPRVRETAKRLWMIYVGITVVEVLLLLPAMDFFDAVNHAFATMATGGFSTKNGSVGQFGSAYVDWVITVFMILAGANFALHYRLLRGQVVTFFRDSELRVYLLIILASSVVIALSTWTPILRVLPEQGSGGFAGYDTLWEALRYGAFQAASIITTTGFGTADYELWPSLAIVCIFLLFFVGGMAGSTGGGVKIVRHILVFKNSFKEINQLIHPQAIMPVRLNNQVVPPGVLGNVLSFVVLYIACAAIGIAVLSALGLDLLTAIGATLSCVGNIGPGFGTVGPAENYAHFPGTAKWLLSVLMIAGRLELFTVLILFVPAFWRR